MKTKLLIISSLFLSINNAISGGGGISGGATEVTQLMNNSELITQIETARQQLETMHTNLKRLKNFTVSGENLIEDLKSLQNAIQVGQVIAYDAFNLAEQFENKYKDFNEYAKNFTLSDDKTTSEKYQRWSRDNLDNIQSALMSANLQSQHFKSEAQAIKEIEYKAQTAEGRDALLQAGIEISALQSSQLIQLRQLIASDMQMQANYQASIVQRQAEKDAVIQKLHSNDNLDKYLEKNPEYYGPSNLFK